MKLCVLAPEFIPVWGGAGTYTQELVEHLPHEHEIHVVTPRRKAFGLHAVDVSEDHFELGNNIHLHYVSDAADTVVYNAGFQYACMKHVPRILDEEQIDLIQSHMSHMPDLLLRLRRRNIPTVVTLHNTIRVQRFAIRLSSQPFYALEKSEQLVCTLYPFLRLAERLYLDGTKLCIAPSKWMKEQALRSSSNSTARTDRIWVIPNSVDANKCKKAAELGKTLLADSFVNHRVILYCGRLLANKGLEVMMQAMPKILRSMQDDLLFLFVGPGDSRVYSDKLRALGVSSDNFRFIAPLSRQKCLELMGCAEALILPSFLENCPYSVLEAMACEVPVIASDVGGIPEMIEDGQSGLTFTSGSPSELCQKTIELLEDAGLRRKLKQNARRLVVDKYSWASNLGMQMQAYESALN